MHPPPSPARANNLFPLSPSTLIRMYNSAYHLIWRYAKTDALDKQPRANAETIRINMITNNLSVYLEITLFTR